MIVKALGVRETGGKVSGEKATERKLARRREGTVTGW